jgi:hypothetical protein
MRPVHFPTSRYHIRFVRRLCGDRYLVIADLSREAPHVECCPAWALGVLPKTSVPHILVPEIEYLAVNRIFKRDLSGDTIRQLIRGRHNSAIRGYDRLWI